jgi:hypothetical protein
MMTDKEAIDLLQDVLGKSVTNETQVMITQSLVNALCMAINALDTVIYIQENGIRVLSEKKQTKDEAISEYKVWRRTGE